MAPNPAILASTLIVALFAGCLGDGSPVEATEVVPPDGADQEPAPETEESPATSPPAAPADPFAGCPRGTNNYGVSTTIGDYYVFDHRGGNLYVVYEESNGLGALQTEEECAKPDTKIAEVEEPFLADLLKALRANA